MADKVLINLPKELIPEEFVSAKGEGLASWRLIDRPANLALFSTSNGLVAMHGSAAYERVRFEKLRTLYRDKISKAGIIASGKSGIRSGRFKDSSQGNNFPPKSWF